MRDEIVSFLRAELIGPDPVDPHIQANGEEILISDPPRLRYGAGVLFPRGVETESSEDLEPEESTGFEIETENDEDEEIEAEVAVQEERSGREGIEDTAAEEITTLTNSFLPSAIGFSCLAKLPEGGFTVEVKAGTYTAEAREYTSGDEIKVGRQFPRTALEYSFQVPRKELTGEDVRRWSDRVMREDDVDTKLEVMIISRPRPLTEDGYECRLLTVVLVNCHESSTGRTDNDKCFFQVDLQIRASDGSAPFLEYPERDGEPLDDEEDSLRLLYRHRKTYAIGHGCAADWHENGEGSVDLIRSDTLPSFEVKPINPTAFPDLDLSMKDLSTLGDKADIPRMLGTLCDKYESWIGDQILTVAGPDFPKAMRDTASGHIENCRDCLERMRSGLSLLQSDATVMQSFRLANRAMLLQQLHFDLDLRSWDISSGGQPSIDPVNWPDPLNPSPDLGFWRPFQIAFILMSLISTAHPDHHERDIVDLIWFPTGGGKTEAYLGLTAFTIFYRRLSRREDAGTAVLMRYTLRLLTTQQFQRSAALICACEVVRRGMVAELGDDPVTIGLWVGKSLTPNKRADAVSSLGRLSRGQTRENPFLLLQCPWCGAQMGQIKAGKGTRILGYVKTRRPATVVFKCPDASCDFSQGLPLLVIDEDIYSSPPTLLIGTVDKFALLPWYPSACTLFGIGNEKLVSPPNLIIQDELHLISGPLGSMVGHYETIIDQLCSGPDDGNQTRPKIIASTATISRAAEQVRALYAREVCLFPPQCLRAGDSFFAEEDETVPGRLYVGVHASALPSHVTAQVRVSAALLQAVLSIPVARPEDRDPYWTLINYFNSLRELGHAATLIRADIREYLNAMWNRKNIRKTENADPRRFINHAIELTSRVSSNDIPEALQKLDTEYPRQRDSLPVDVCLASNMISVGIDIQRLGLMTVVGQPKTTSEYIQATSRVGRRHPGLVIPIYNTGKPRDRSHFEHFRSFHASLYRQVEPTSVTPFAAPVRDRALHALLVTMVRYWGNSENKNRPQPYPERDLIARIRGVIEQRVSEVDADELGLTLEHLDQLLNDWQRILPSQYGGFGPPSVEIPLMYPSGSQPPDEWVGRSWPTPSSMRNVDANCEANVISSYPEIGEA